MSTLIRQLRTLTQAGVTPADIAAAATSIGIEIDNVDTGNTDRESLQSNLDEVVSILNALGVGSATIATAQTQNLASAGQSFPIDLTTLTPPVSARNCAVWVQEKGTAGGDLFAQQLTYIDAVAPSVFYSEVVNVTGTPIFYAIPQTNGRVLKIDADAKTSYEISSTQTGQWLGGVYSPVFNQIVCPNNTPSTGFLLIDVGTDTVTELPNNPVTHAEGILLDDGRAAFYASNGVIRAYDFNTQTATGITPVLTTSGSIPYRVLHQFGDYIFTPPYQATSNNYAVYDLNGGTWSTYSLSSFGSRGWGHGALVGNKIYYSSRISPSTDVLVAEINDTGAAPTFSNITIGRTGFFGAKEIENKIYMPSRDSPGGGFIVVDVSTDTAQILGNATGFGAPDKYLDRLIFAPPLGGRVTEVDVLPPFNEDPSNPFPYNSVTNFFDSSGTVNRMASTEDYDITFTESGGNLTQVEITMLTEGAKDVTAVVLNGGF